MILPSKILKSETSIYIFNKYFTYALQFVLLILCAKLLGIKYFAIYSFIKLIGQYHSYTNFGINFSFNVLASTSKDSDKNLLYNLFNNAFILNLVFIFISVCLMIVLLNSNIEIFIKYSLKNYIVPVVLFLSFKQINVLFVTCSRLENKLRFINFFYLLPVLLELLALLFYYDSENAILYILWSLVISHSSISIFFIFKNLSNFSFNYFDFITSQKIIVKGLKLLIYNFTFYYLLIGAKSFVSKYSSLESFSNFSLSSNLVEGVSMLLSAITFLIFPKILNQITNKSNSDLISFMNRNDKLYALSLSSLFFSILLLYPLIEIIFPEFNNLDFIIIGLSFSSFLLSNTFLYSSFLIQRKQEYFLIKIGLFSILLLFFICFTGLSFGLDIINTTVSSLFICNFTYNFLMHYKSYKLLNLNENPFIKSLIKAIAIKYSFPMYIFIIALFFQINISLLFSLFILIAFILINLRLFYNIYKKVIQIFSDNDYLSIKGFK